MRLGRGQALQAQMEARRADDAARAAVRDKQMRDHQRDMRKRLAEFRRRDAAMSEEMARVKQWEVREATPPLVKAG
jgi:hypothetical protein